MDLITEKDVSKHLFDSAGFFSYVVGGLYNYANPPDLRRPGRNMDAGGIR